MSNYIVQLCRTKVDLAFYPLWDDKMSTIQRAVMLCIWEGSRRPGGK